MIRLLNDPDAMIGFSVLCIFSYLVVSVFFFGTGNSERKDGFFLRNGWFDRLTTLVWSGWSVLLLVSLIILSSKNSLSLQYLLVYYGLFIFIFGMCYSLLEWHFEGHFDMKSKNFWDLEIQFLIMSIQSQTTIGHTSLKPARRFSELLVSLQALLGIFFLAIFVSRAVNQVAG